MQDLSKRKQLVVPPSQYAVIIFSDEEPWWTIYPSFKRSKNNFSIKFALIPKQLILKRNSFNAVLMWTKKATWKKMVNSPDYQGKEYSEREVPFIWVLYVNLLRLWGWLIIRQKKRQTPQSQVRDEHPESTKGILLFAFAVLMHKGYALFKKARVRKGFWSAYQGYLHSLTERHTNF